MHWTEAVNTSEYHLAMRQDSERRLVFRRADGTGGIETFLSRDRKLDIPQFRPAEMYELEGFDDWSPAVGLLNPAFVQ